MHTHGVVGALVWEFPVSDLVRIAASPAAHHVDVIPAHSAVVVCLVNLVSVLPAVALEGGEGVDGSRRHEEGQQRRQHGHRRQEPDADAALDAAAENGAAGPCAGHHGTLKVGSCCCLSLRQRRGLLSWGLCAVSLPPFPLPLKPGNGGPRMVSSLPNL